MELEESRSLDLSDDTSSQSDHLLEKYPQFLLRSFIPREQYSRRFHTPGVIALLYVAIIGLSASLVYLVYRPTRCSDPSQGFYCTYHDLQRFSSLSCSRKANAYFGPIAPAQEVIHYVTKVFPENFRNKGPYMGSPETGLPTNETDILWEELYQCEHTFSHTLFLRKSQQEKEKKEKQKPHTNNENSWHQFH
jgi:hypothetical protein